MHPHKAHPNNSRAAFREYAASDAFTAIHIGDYVGTLGIVLALVVLYRSLPPHQGPSGAAALVGVVAAVLVAAIFAVQMAVDGVALKAAVDDWVAAPKAQQDAAFRVADGIRDIEKGLSGFFQLTDGVALLGFGLAVALGRSYPRWLAVAGVLAGLGSLFGGWATALTGFSEEAQTFGLPTVVLLVVFVVRICVCLWRRSFHDGSLATGRTSTPTSRTGDQI